MSEEAPWKQFQSEQGPWASFEKQGAPWETFAAPKQKVGEPSIPTPEGTELKTKQDLPRSLGGLINLVDNPPKGLSDNDLIAVDATLSAKTGINLKLFFDPKKEDQLNPLTRPFRQFNSMVAKGAYGIVEADLKGLNAAFRTIVGLTADSVEKVTGDKGAADRLERDLLSMPEAFPSVVAGGGAAVGGSTIARTIKLEQSVDDIVKRATLQVSPVERAALERRIRAEMKSVPSVSDASETARIATARVFEARQQVKVPSVIASNVQAFQDDILKAAGAVQVASKHQSEQVYEIIGGLRLDKPVLQQAIKDHGITNKDIPDIIGKPSTSTRQVQEHADFLHVIADLRLGAELGSKNAQRALDAYANKEWAGDRLHNFFEAFHKFENIRRGLMVSSLATAVRNATVATGRIGLDVVNDALDIAIGRAGQKAGLIRMDAEDLKPFESFGNTLEWLVRANTTDKGSVEKVIKAFPAQYDKFVGRMIAQIESSKAGTLAEEVLGAGLRKAAGAEPSIAERGVYVANVFNRFQEMVFRRAKVASVLDDELKKMGTSLEVVTKENNLGAITESMLSKAIDEALDFTFAGDPKSKFVRDTVQRLTRIPGVTLEIPFPRFVTQATRFMWEHSPGAAFNLLDKNERAKIAAGDVSLISKMTSGGALGLAAWQGIESGDIKMGDNWHEVYFGDKKVDIAAYQPFAAWVFLADTIKRVREDRFLPQNFTLDTIAEGMLSTAAQMGTGFELADGLVRTLLDLDKANKEGSPQARLGSAVGNYVTSFLTPINQLSDFFAQFDEAERKLRDVKVSAPGEEKSPFWQALSGRVMGRTPIVKQMLPEKEFATREGPKESTAIPLLRAMLGVKVLDKSNSLEKELGRLGFNYKNTEPFTGVPEIDRVLAHEMGILSERKLIPLVESQGYQKLPDATKAYILEEQISVVRKAAKEIATAKNPQLFAGFSILDMPAVKMRMLERMQQDKGIEPTLSERMKNLMRQGKEKVREEAQQQK